MSVTMKVSKKVIQAEKFDSVIHLAVSRCALPITNPHAYIDANIQGFMNVLECCRELNVGHLIYASSSSVYGGNVNKSFSERHNVDHPISL